MPLCSACGATFVLGASKCAECGAPLEARSSSVMAPWLSPAEEASLLVPIWLAVLLGLLGIGGGFLGLVAAALGVAQAGWSLTNTLVLAVVVVLYCFGMYCGVVALLRRGGWYNHNLLFWWLQVPLAATPLCSYGFAAGAHVTVWARFNPLGAGTNFGFGSIFQLKLFAPNPWIIGANLFALAVVFLLIRASKRRAV